MIHKNVADEGKCIHSILVLVFYRLFVGAPRACRGSCGVRFIGDWWMGRGPGLLFLCVGGIAVLGIAELAKSGGRS